ncbi:MAG: hypothetical protein EZS28_054273, partial [Streblomastix strix]
MTILPKSKLGAILVLVFIYIATITLSIFFFKLITLKFELKGLNAFFSADIFATLLLWLIGVIVGNPCVFDLQWSIVPPVFLLSFYLYNGRVNKLEIEDIWFIGTVLFWAVRLTFNCLVNWGGFDHIDWRIINFKNKGALAWFFINLTSIHLIPTLITFTSMLP